MKRSPWHVTYAVYGYCISIISLIFAPALAPAQAVSEPTRWDLAGSPYTVTSLVIGAGGVLTVEAGVEIRVAPGGSVVVAAGGALALEGTAGAPVLLTSGAPVPAPGDWQNVTVREGATATWSHVVVEYGGGRAEVGGAVVLQSSGAALSDVTVRHSAHDGVAILAGDSGTVMTAPTLARVTVEQGGRHGVWLPAQTATGAPAVLTDLVVQDCVGAAIAVATLNEAPLVDGATLARNGFNGADVTTPGWATRRDVTLTGGMDWRVAQLVVGAGTTLRVEAAARVLFPAAAAEHEVRSGGRLEVLGTVSDPVVLTSAEPAPAAGDWAGLTIRTGAGAVVRHARFEYGGRPTQRGLLSIRSSDVLVEDTRVAHGSADGILVMPVETGTGPVEPVLRRLDVEDCAESAVRLQTQAPTGARVTIDGLVARGCGGPAIQIQGFDEVPMLAGLDLVANGFDGVDVMAGNPATRDFTLSGGVRWRLARMFLTAGVTARFEAGAEVLMRKYTPAGWEGLMVPHGAALLVEGTAERPVVWRSAEDAPAPGDWQPVALAGRGIGRLSHVRIEHGSGVRMEGGDVELRDVTVVAARAQGAVWHNPVGGVPYGRPLFRNLVVSEAVGEPVLISPMLSHAPIIDGLRIDGPASPAVMLGGGVFDTGLNGEEVVLPTIPYPWRGPSGAYLGNAHIIVPPGTVLELGEPIQVGSNQLTMLGTAEAPIILRPDPASTRQTAGIVAGEGGRVRMVHCVVAMGGRQGLVEVNGNPTGAENVFEATDCVFSDAATGSGVYLLNASARFVRCRMTGNARDGVEAQSSYANRVSLFESCDLSNNGRHGAAIMGAVGLVDCDIRNNAQVGVWTMLYNDVPADRRPRVEACRVVGNGSFAVQNNVTSQAGKLVARGLWWGDPSGPLHPTLNPAGLGGRVSDHVVFIPWATSPEGGAADASALVLGTPTAGSAGGTARHFLELRAGEARHLLVRLVPGSDDGVWTLLQRDGQPPTSALYDRAAIERHGALEILVTNPPAGILHLAVVRSGGTTETGVYTIECQPVTRYLARVGTTSAGNGGTTTQQLFGCGFLPGQAVELRRDGALLRAFTATSTSDTAATVAMDLLGVAAGPVDLLVRWSDGYTDELPTAMSLRAGTGPQVVAEFPSNDVGLFRNGQVGEHHVDIGNRGDADAEAFLVVVEAPEDVALSPLLTEEPGPGPLQFLAFGSVDNPAIIPPGTIHRAPFYYNAATSFRFVARLRNRDNTPIDWEAQKQGLRPAVIDPAAWDSAWPAIRSALGNDVATHIDRLLPLAERVARRGDGSPYRPTSVSHLVDLEARRVLGLPVAAVAGRLLLMPHARPQPSAVVKLFDVANPDAAPQMVRSTSSGAYCFTDLPDSVYTVTVEGYYLDRIAEVHVSGQSDVTGFDLLLHETDPRPAGAPARIAGTAPVLVNGPTGTAFLAWENGGRLQTLAWSADGWRAPTPLAGATGASPALAYGPSMLGPGLPGLLAVWESAGDDGVTRLAASSGRWVDGRLEWTTPRLLTADGADDTHPTILQRGDGTWAIAWIQRGGGAVYDDTDVYTMSVDPTVVTTWWVPPAAVMASDKDVCDSFNFATSITIPKRLQEVFGTRYKAEAGWQLCAGPLTCAQFEKSGGATLAVELGDALSFNAEGAMKSLARLACRPCRYIPSTMTMTATGGLEANFARPIPIIIGGIPLGTAKGSLPVSIALRTRLGWYHEMGGVPDSGLVAIDCTAGGRILVEDHLGIGKGQGDLGITGSYQWNPNEGFKIDGACITLSGEAAIFGGFAKRRFVKQWGDACGKTLPELGEKRWESHDLIAYESHLLDDGILVSEQLSLSIAPSVGTGAIHEGDAVLAAIAGDLYDDGRPALHRDAATGALTMAWTKDTGDHRGGLGNQVVVASNDGSGWTVPTPIEAARHFNRDPVLAVAADGSLVMVWSRADATGLNDTSSILDVDAAAARGEIVYTRRVAGQWSAPAPIAPRVGDNMTPCLVRVGTRLSAVWVRRLATGDELVSATWDGLRWTVPVVVSAAPRCVSPTAVPMGDRALLVWSEEEPETVIDGKLSIDRAPVMRLRHSLASGATWSAPMNLPDDFGVSLGEKSIVADTTRHPKVLAEAKALPRPPQDCCGEGCKPTYRKPRPRTPPEPLRPGDEQGMGPIVSRDPNEKHGPAGWGVANVVRGDGRFVYTILFENQPTATAPARDVIVTDDLAPSLDWSTFEIEAVGWSGEVHRPSGRTDVMEEFVPVNDWRPDVTTPLLIRINAQVDRTSGRAQFTFRTLDATTEEAPLDPLAGFLPPNDATHRGEGFVRFAIRPVAEPADPVITNRAVIVFDLEAPIITNTVSNRLGDPDALWRALRDRLLGIDNPLLPVDANGDGVMDAADLVAP